MAYTSTETTVQVLAGDASHVGRLEVGFQRMILNGPLGDEGPPPYDYKADAIAIAKFLEKFLPAETWTELKFRFRVSKT